MLLQQHYVARWALRLSGQHLASLNLTTYFHNTSFDGVRLEAFGSHHGQVKFSVPAMSGSGEDEKYATDDDLVEVIGRDKTVTAPQQKKGGVQAVAGGEQECGGSEVLQCRGNDARSGLLTVGTENNVVEEGYGVTDGKKVQGAVLLISTSL